MIYFACSLDDPELLIKIGYTRRDPDKRIAELQPGSPVQLSVIGTMEGTTSDEREIHRQFVKSRRHGEWFCPTPDLMQFLRDSSRPGIDARARGVLESPETIRQFAQILGWPESEVVDGLHELLAT